MFDKKVMFLVSSALIVTTGLSVGNYFYNKTLNSTKEENILQNSVAKNLQNAISNLEEEKTTKDTKLIYEYMYNPSGNIRKTEKQIPIELANKSRKIIENTFDEWSVITFSPQKVVLRKNIDSKNTSYILKEYQGFISVFYNDNNFEELKEITEIPVSTLPEDDQILLKKGIYIQGNKNLLKTLQDYES